MKSRTLAASIALVALAASPAGAIEDRTLSAQIDAASLTEVRLESGVGDVEVFSCGGNLISAEVTLSPRRGGIFSSLKAARRQIQDAVLETEIHGDALEITIDSEGKDQRFEARWTLVLPPHLAFALELGVGDVKINDLKAPLDLEVGVGEVDIVVKKGSIQAEVGVGGCTILAPVGEFGAIEAAAGVGDVVIKADGHKIVGEGFIGHSAEWKGDGEGMIDVEVGVGNVRVILQ